MTHTREKHEGHAFHCDSCPGVFAPGPEVEDFTEAFALAKEKGWTTFKHEEHFHHECPVCSEES